MKRFFDLFFTVPGLLILFPFFIIIAILVRIDSPGAIFYKQERIGRYGRPFKIYKFRTMVVNADKIGLPITVGKDPRITKIGEFLRKFKLDELPQLINILKGDMSLVGPRPEIKYYVDMYNDKQRCVLELIPGLTDLASIKYKNENALLAAAQDSESGLDPDDVYIKEILPDKIEINLKYAENATVFTDFLVILKTLLGFGYNDLCC